MFRPICLLSVFLTFEFVLAQQSATEPEVKFSCPPTNLVSVPLVTRAHAIGPKGFYSIFECWRVQSSQFLIYLMQYMRTGIAKPRQMLQITNALITR